MVSVVIGTHIDPVAEADASLADVRHLGENEVVSRAGFAVGDGLRIAFAVPDRCFLQPEQIGNGGRQVNVIPEGVVGDAFLAAVPLDDHGDPAGDVVGSGVLCVAVQFPDILTMVGSDDEGNIIYLYTGGIYTATKGMPTGITLEAPIIWMGQHHFLHYMAVGDRRKITATKFG